MNTRWRSWSFMEWFALGWTIATAAIIVALVIGMMVNDT